MPQRIGRGQGSTGLNMISMMLHTIGKQGFRVSGLRVSGFRGLGFKD